ncbi:uncharacterized protein [Fopius arisanus]|uniref:Uncharacterized protein n=1 Tax=Fopius arisanus TaxID=64838 RepID=A0A9R1T6U9_9HYME|nr:PREDICTED: uncharacterized protein LOC105266974 [Fopius arisanus]
MRQNLKTLSRRPNTQVAVSLGTGSVLLVGSSESSGGTRDGEMWRDCSAMTTRSSENNGISHQDGQPTINATQGLVQLRTVDRDEASVDTQETSCYVLEGLTENDSNAIRVET